MPTPESMEELSAEAKALLSFEKHRPDDPRIPMEALTARLSNSLSLPNLNDVVSSPTIAPAKTFVIKHLLSQAAGVLIGSVMGGAAVYAVMSSKMSRPEATSPVPAEIRASPPTREVPKFNPPLPPKTTLHKPVADKKTPRLDVTLDEENLLIERARTAMLRKTMDAALNAVTTHEQRFPRGNLAEERDVLRVQILAQMGRSAEAMQHAKQFEAKYPNSLLLPVVQPFLLQPQ